MASHPNPFRQPPPPPPPHHPPPSQTPATTVEAKPAENRLAFAQLHWDTPAPKQPVPETPDAPLPPFRVGMLIDNERIKLLDFVGQGSFAHVYLGYDHSTSSKCAVKCLLKAGADPKKMAMQKREVKAMEDLNGHPNVIRLIRTVESAEWLLIIMEFCQIDLYEAIMQKGGFPDFAVKDVFSQLCDGVMHCHSRGYYHRDMKPENILLDVGNLTAKITDFGLATRDTWSYEMGCGSTRYIPPEATASADPTKGYSPIASDVWALGILLVNLLFSKNPWFEATMEDPIFSIYVTTRPDILRHHFKISEEFDAILHRVFNLDPAKRLALPDFKRLVNALPTFLEEDLENSVPQSVPESTEAVAAAQQHQPIPPSDRQTPVSPDAVAPPLPLQKNSNPFRSAKGFGSGRNNTFGSSKMQGPLVVFGSIPDTKYTQFEDPKNPFNSNPRATPMNLTTSDIYNPFSSDNGFASQSRPIPPANTTPETEQPPVNPFFHIAADGNFILPIASSNPPSIHPPPPIAPIISTNPSLTTLIWTAPARVADPELPNTLTLGREGIGRIGISRLATAKQRFSNRAASRRGVGGLHANAAGGIEGDLDMSYPGHSALRGLAFLGTAIAGYVNPDEDEILEGDEVYDSEEMDDDLLDAEEGAPATLNRSAPDEESHYEVVKVDRRLIPDLEKGIKRAVNRGMKKFRPFMHLEAAGGGAAGGGSGVAVTSSMANLKLGKGVAGKLALSTEDWSEFAATRGGGGGAAMGGSNDQMAMPGAFFEDSKMRRQSMPMVPLGELNASYAELPLYKSDTIPSSPMRGGKSVESLPWREEALNDESDDDLRTSRSRRRHGGGGGGADSVLSKMYNLLGGSRSKSHKRSMENHASVPLRNPHEESILPAPQVPFAFLSAKNIKSRASEKDFEALVVNAKPSLGSIPQLVPKLRHRVKTKSNGEDLAALDPNKATSRYVPAAQPHPSPQQVEADVAVGSLANGGQFSSEIVSPRRLSLGRPPSLLEGHMGKPLVQLDGYHSLGRPLVQLEGHHSLGRPQNHTERISPHRLSVSLNRPIMDAPQSATVPPAQVEPAVSPEQSSNPFRLRNPPSAATSNPFQRPTTMYNYQSTNPFQPQLLSPDAQHHYNQQQRYSTPLPADLNIYGPYSPQQASYQHQISPQQLAHPHLSPHSESPFQPLPYMHPHQQQQPIPQQHSHHNQNTGVPNTSFHPSTTTTMDPRYAANSGVRPVVLDRAAQPRGGPILEDDDEISGGGGVDAVDESITGGGGDSDDDSSSIRKRGEGRYVRGLVRGFGWLVGGGRETNHVERSDSHGV
ncbi:hypothetical protein HDU98_011067 [Podochytrium sp. JEL0797]|nr:hypothetical protein HDU98_011067 [Podochytrium sp. JEL0797]